LYNNRLQNEKIVLKKIYALCAFKRWWIDFNNRDILKNGPGYIVRESCTLEKKKNGGRFPDTVDEEVGD
jgi:hypothetical protein